MHPWARASSSFGSAGAFSFDSFHNPDADGQSWAEFSDFVRVTGGQASGELYAFFNWSGESFGKLASVLLGDQSEAYNGQDSTSLSSPFIFGGLTPIGGVVESVGLGRGGLQLQLMGFSVYDSAHHLVSDAVVTPIGSAVNFFGSGPFPTPELFGCS